MSADLTKQVAAGMEGRHVSASWRVAPRTKVGSGAPEVRVVATVCKKRARMSRSDEVSELLSAADNFLGPLRAADGLREPEFAALCDALRRCAEVRKPPQDGPADLASAPHLDHRPLTRGLQAPEQLVDRKDERLAEAR